MYPILLDWGPIFVPSWHFFVALGAIAAFYAVVHIQTRHYSSVGTDHLRVLFALCYFGGLIGSRAAEVLVTGEAQSFAEFIQRTFSLGGMVFYGGMILGLLLGWIYCLCKKLPPAIILDISMPGVFLGLALGRIGCFLNGDDYGTAGSADSLFTVIFPNLGDDTPRYATQLMESALAFCLFLAGVWGLKRSTRPGQIGLTLLVLYSAFRFGLEYLRDDPRGFLLLPTLSTSQGISLIFILLGIMLILRSSLRRTAS